MKVLVDISVFSSPVDSYAAVWGQVEVQSLPKVGDELTSLLLEGCVAPPIRGQNLRVDSKLAVELNEAQCSVQLTDIVLEGHDEAEQFVRHLADNFGMHVERHKEV